MHKRMIKEDVYWLGAIDWDRHLFDALIPLPEGTSYNSYLVYGSEKTVLFDTVDPEKKDILLEQLKDVEKIDYIVTHHAEQDHSGSLPFVLEKYPEAKVVCMAKCKSMLIDHLQLPEDCFMEVKNGEELSLGNKTLSFHFMPWVHWPETMVSWLKEDRILFSCDFFGSHLATSDLFATDKSRVYTLAKRYYAEIMMPFKLQISKHIKKVREFDPLMICPSHGPVYNEPGWIIDAYDEWGSGLPENKAVVLYVSMHNSTRLMVEHLVDELVNQGVSLRQFDLIGADIGEIALELVDAATIVIGTPTLFGGPHPNVAYAAFVANILKPKAKFATVVGSKGWGGKVAERLVEMLPNLQAEILDPVICRGLPTDEVKQSLSGLAEQIAKKHQELGLK